MDYPKDPSRSQYDFNNIQRLLITQLNKSRQENPQSFSKDIHVLSAVNDDDEGQMEQQLQQERQDHTGERILLIPYCLENSLWTGIMIEFRSNSQILRAEYMNPVSGRKTVPNGLRRQLTKVYPSAVIESKDLYQHNDPRFSSALTVKNLSTAAENSQRSSFDSIESQSTNNSISTGNDKNRYSTTSESPNSSSNQASLQTSTSFSEAGNQYTLAEKQQELSRGLEKYNIRSIDALPQKIQRTETQIKFFEEDNRADDAEREKALLRELQRLQSLADQITTLEQESAKSENSVEKKARQMKEELSAGLAKLNIRDVEMLVQKIQRTETQIKFFEEDNRTDDAEREKALLRELQRLQSLADQIATLEQETVKSENSVEKKARQMKEELSAGLAKLNIRDVEMLVQKIQRTETQIKFFEEDNRADDAEREKALLRELQRLQSLADQIATLEQETVKSENSVEKKARQMKEELSAGLAKLNIRDVEMLVQKIQRTETQIKFFEEDNRTDDAEREKALLRELQRLQSLADQIATLEQETVKSENSVEKKARQMKEELSAGLAKLNIRDVEMLVQKIQRTETQIKFFEEDNRTDDAEREKALLRELQRLQSLADQIATLEQETVKSENSVEKKARQMKEELSAGLAKLNIRDVEMLVQKIQRTETQIKFFEEDNRTDDAEREKALLRELQRLQTLANEIATLQSVPPPSVPPLDEPITPEPDANNTITLDDARKKRLYIYDLDAEVKMMPPCARKTLSKLLVHFEKKSLEDQAASKDQESLLLSLQTLKDQVKREEFSSDDVKAILHNLEMHITNENDSLTVRYLNELLKKFRSLNVAEIQRLIGKATEAAELIENKDVVLFIGTTGSGKSTTIQFLAGATMKEVRVEVRPGKFLEHVTAVGKISNSDLRQVISSPLQKSETRYIAPVSVQLKDILGAHETGVLTLCDAPGFGDTAGPEVDIANSIGVIEALKKAKSVKILALLSLKDLGSRGQGVEKLAHILISMVHGIEEKLDAIVYGFTKFSASTDINALLLETKRSKVDEDPSLQSDTAFVSVLKDMIEKTEEDAMKIEPTKDDPKKLVRKLKNLRGIKNPQEVFRFSMSEETRAAISDHVQRDKFSIICAMKHKDYELINYYLNDLQILMDLLKESFIRDVYDESVRFVSESISNYSTEIKNKFNRVLASQDGLQNKDILDYRTAISYLENAQILKAASAINIGCTCIDGTKYH